VSRQQTVNRIVLAISIVSYAFFMLLTFERKTVFYAPRVQSDQVVYDNTWPERAGSYDFVPMEDSCDQLCIR